MPSFTFVSTANAFVLRGATPVFVDIRPDTLNIDESRIEAAITPRTKAVVVVHYAGVACNMADVAATARRHGLPVVEDAAQGLMASYRGRPLGALGDLAAFSLRDQEHPVWRGRRAGDERRAGRSEPRSSGRKAPTARNSRAGRWTSTWVDVGSSFLPGELTAAFLWAQLEAAAEITAARMALWQSCAGLRRARGRGTRVPRHSARLRAQRASLPGAATAPPCRAPT